MSYWTYINGTITVSPMGRTQAEKQYILDSVLDYLPAVTGSEGGMDIYTIKKNGYSSVSRFDEFGNRMEKAFRIQDDYIIIIEGSLRDRMFDRTLREFNKWICRLSKRVIVKDILIKINSDSSNMLITNKEPYSDMFVDPSWYDKTSENWCESLF